MKPLLNFLLNSILIFKLTYSLPNQQSTCCYDKNIEYVGNLNTSSSGKPCLIWETQFEPQVITKLLHSCKGRYLDNNFCKSIDGPGTPPKCVVSAGVFEQCAVEKCSETKTDKIGINYRGQMQESFAYDDAGNVGSGRKQHFTCMRWDGVDKHPLIRIKERPVETNHNFCRNPDNDPNGPWCYKQNWRPKYHVQSGNLLNSNFFYCDIPVCSKIEPMERCNYDMLYYKQAKPAIKESLVEDQVSTKPTLTPTQTNTQMPTTTSTPKRCDLEKFEKLYVEFYKKFLKADSELEISRQQISSLNLLVREYQEKLAALELKLAKVEDLNEMKENKKIGQNNDEVNTAMIIEPENPLEQLFEEFDIE